MVCINYQGLFFGIKTSKTSLRIKYIFENNLCISFMEIKWDKRTGDGLDLSTSLVDKL